MAKNLLVIVATDVDNYDNIVVGVRRTLTPDMSPLKYIELGDKLNQNLADSNDADAKYIQLDPNVGVDDIKRLWEEHAGLDEIDFAWKWMDCSPSTDVIARNIQSFYENPPEERSDIRDTTSEGIHIYNEEEEEEQEETPAQSSGEPLVWESAGSGTRSQPRVPDDGRVWINPQYRG